MMSFRADLPPPPEPIDLDLEAAGYPTVARAIDARSADPMPARTPTVSQEDRVTAVWTLAILIVGIVLVVAVGVAALPRSRAEPPRVGFTPELRPGLGVHLAPIGDIPPGALDDLVARFDQRYGLELDVLPTLPIPAEVLDPARDQLSAQALLTFIAGQHVVASTGRDVVIGIVAGDMYIEGNDWRYAYGLRREPLLAVVATARMGDLREEGSGRRRLRAMVSREIGFLYFGLDLSDDPRSTMFRDVLGPDDLDRMDGEY